MSSTSTTTTSKSFPSVPEMIRTHTLAHNIITRHNTPNDVLDATELSLLQQYTTSPSTTTTTTIPNPDNSSLVQSIIHHQTTQDPFLTPSELTLLKNFFSALTVDISNGAGNMLRTNTLAYNLILRPHEIYDSDEFAIMREFCTLPDPDDVEVRKGILRKWDMLDDDDDVVVVVEDSEGTTSRDDGDVAPQPPSLYGDKCKAKGSLSGYCVGTYGTGHNGRLSREEVEVLGEWFRNGGPVAV